MADQFLLLEHGADILYTLKVNVDSVSPPIPEREESFLGFKEVYGRLLDYGLVVPGCLSKVVVGRVDEEYRQTIPSPLENFMQQSPLERLLAMSPEELKAKLLSEVEGGVKGARKRIYNPQYPDASRGGAAAF